MGDENVFTYPVIVPNPRIYYDKNGKETGRLHWNSSGSESFVERDRSVQSNVDHQQEKRYKNAFYFIKIRTDKSRKNPINFEDQVFSHPVEIPTQISTQIEGSESKR